MAVQEQSISHYYTADLSVGFLQYSGVYVDIGSLKVAYGSPGTLSFPL